MNDAMQPDANDNTRDGDVAEDLILGKGPRSSERGARTGVGARQWRPQQPRRRLTVEIAAMVAGAIVAVGGVVLAAAGTGTEWQRCPDQGSAQIDVRRLRELTEAENQALVSPDPDRLNHLLAADFTLITPDGDTLTRDDLVDAVASEDLDFRSIRIDDDHAREAFSVRLDCNMATITYRSKLDVASGTAHYKHDARHTTIWLKTGETWAEIQTQTTALGGFPPPDH